MEDEIRKIVLTYVSKTVKEKQEAKQNFYGNYYNGNCNGRCFPDRMIQISKHSADSISVAYTVGSRMWNYIFKFSELRLSESV